MISFEITFSFYQYIFLVSMRGVTLFSLLNKIYHTKEQEKSDRRYFQWGIAHVTVKFFGSLSYSCYFSVVAATEDADATVAVALVAN